MNNSLEGTNENNAQSKQRRELDNATEETPLVVLKENQRGLLATSLILVAILLFNIFGVFLPVITTGDYAAVWGSNETTWIGTKTALFYLSWIAIPLFFFFLILFVRISGDLYFYEDRLVLETEYFPRRVTIPYKQMYVLQVSMSIIITTQSLDGCSDPLRRFIVRWWDGVSFGTIFDDPKVAGMKMGLNYAYDNPGDGRKAVEILKERAFSFKN